MPDHGSPSVRRRQLAAELRRLRERAGFTGELVAERLGWSGSKLSRIETSRTGVKQGDLRLNARMAIAAVENLILTRLTASRPRRRAAH
jgi:transcriptional regulator with XRE-family HTH domain